MIPLIDLKQNHWELKEEIEAEIKKIIETSSFVQGENVAKLEKNFAEYCGVRNAIAVNSGTAALYLILKGLDVKSGDEVITTPFTFFATAEAIAETGAKPVFVDINPRTFNLDANKIKEKITFRTKAILPVHLYGQPFDFDALQEIAQEYGLTVIEDACQAHGAEYKGKKTGSLGTAAAFSFYPTKNLGALGEGGMVTTNDEALAQKIRLLRAHGENPKYTHHLVGYNFRLEEIQGTVLNLKLKYLEQKNELRRKNAQTYLHLLSEIPEIEPPYEEAYAKHVYHLFVIKTKQRERLVNFLNEKKIGTAIHYPRPLHLQPAFRELKYQLGDFPVAEEVAQQILSLPMFPEMTEEQIKTVVEAVKDFYQGNS